MNLNLLAIDLGAGSGRGMLCHLDDGRLRVDEVHRFPNEPLTTDGTLHWDIPRLLGEVKSAILAAGERLAESGESLDGIGVDAWGVDYALLDRSGELSGKAVHYRDARTDRIMERVFERVPKQAIFEQSGNLFMQFNTLFQLAAELEANPRRFDDVSRLLFIPDLFHHFLSGEQCSERTIASTSQMWHAGSESWCHDLLSKLEIPSRILPDVKPPGTVLGPLREELVRELGLDAAPAVIAGACHDTGAAVAAVPADASGLAPGETWAFLSSGTWSLMGTELAAPLTTPQVLESNFTNEGGVDGTVRFLRIIMGLWLVQESRRAWANEGEELDYDTLTALAREAEPLRSIIAPDDPLFFKAGDMPERIRRFCRESGQPEPRTRGEVLRCALESLALAYAHCARRIERLTGKRIARLHIVGGGSRNSLLNRLAADALGIDVIAGPTEATAMGNALLQAKALGAVTDLAELRAVVRNSCDTTRYAPDPATRDRWKDAGRRFSAIADSRDGISG